MTRISMRGRAQGAGSPTALVVVAKAPVPGTVKTRMCPPLTLVQAAILASAAVLDTMDAAEDCGRRVGVVRVLVLAGDLRGAVGGADITRRVGSTGAADAAWQLVGQRGRTFAERLHHAHLDGGAGLATLQIGMDTPQVCGDLLADAVRRLWQPGTDAVLGPTNDGGWWALGLRPGVSSAFLADVPMSTAETGARTLQAMQLCGLRVAELPTLTDVDTVADGQLVAAQIPDTRFARTLNSLLPHHSSLPHHSTLSGPR